ncbi:MAG: DUF4418 family protein [Ruminococcaceae bacterium]|nr:DUF4418 family protein [Oscillospiraceae bacterium]
MKQKITSIGTLIVGLLLAVGPQFIFKPCPTTEKFMKCFWSCKALIVVGAVVAIIALLQLMAKEKESKKLLSVAALALLVSAILIPTVIIGGCAKPEMACKMLTFPVTHSLSVIGIVLQGIGLVGKNK